MPAGTRLAQTRATEPLAGDEVPQAASLRPPGARPGFPRA